MITPDDQERVNKVVSEYWKREANGDEFRSLFAGKEIGHRISGYVDERTTALLEQEFSTKRELSSSGTPSSRSMGDVWLESNGDLHPVNVKAGEADRNGRPNLVSLNRLIAALLSRRIDSYYLLIVKMRWAAVPSEGDVTLDGEDVTEEAPPTLSPQVYFLDMLDHLDFVAFNAGPGQTMLKEKEFYAAIETYSVPTRTLTEKVDMLMKLLRAGHVSLAQQREKTLKGREKDLASFDATLSLDQSGLKLG